MRSCERPRKRSASEALPSSVSNLYCLSIRTQGSSCRRRANPVPSLRRVIDSGPPADRRPSRRSRVASPNAANSGTASGGAGGGCSAAAPRLLDILREMLDLPGPPVVVHAERFGATRERDAIEPRLDDRERGAALGVLERELDQRGGLGRVVHAGGDGVGVPAIREVAFRVDALDQQFQGHVLVAGYGHPAPD